MFKSPASNINGVCGVHNGHQHGQPHQIFMNELMREYDPNDPMNKQRTFERMVESANKKHLNPGEQSFHYYVGNDNKVHGFIAVGNINDKLPHIIISETGSEKTYQDAISEIKQIIEDFNLDELQDTIKDFYEQINKYTNVNKWYTLDPVSE